MNDIHNLAWIGDVGGRDSYGIGVDSVDAERMYLGKSGLRTQCTLTDTAFYGMDKVLMRQWQDFGGTSMAVELSGGLRRMGQKTLH